MSEQSPPSVQDGALVARARAGDLLAFEELVRLYADRLHAVVRRLVDNQDEAEEVTQEAFLRAWRGIATFKGDSQFFTWLYRIGVNEAHRRTSRRRAPVASLEEQLVEPADTRPEPPRRLEQDDLRHALERAVQGLKPDQRAPLVLRDIEGLSTAEGAAILDLGEAAFKSRLHRARLAVRDAVRDYLPEDPER
ncbi:MAG: sigma-70 family RNA polymerase sigma factor [Solirubrobacteraceae bacterium]